MILELTQDGYIALNAKIADLQDKASMGIVDTTRAVAMLRDVRVGLFGLAQLMKATIVIDTATIPAADDSPIGA